jgi:hypothetical protein
MTSATTTPARGTGGRRAEGYGLMRRGDAELVAAGYIPQDTIAASLDATDR